MIVIDQTSVNNLIFNPKLKLNTHFKVELIVLLTVLRIRYLLDSDSKSAMRILDLNLGVFI